MANPRMLHHFSRIHYGVGTEFAKDLEAGRITREHMKMIVEKDTGVAASKLT
jgi:hypothetical protein